MMNNTHIPNFSPQSGFNNQSSVVPRNQYPSRFMNAKFNFPPSFNPSAQRPAFTGVPQTLVQQTTAFPPHSSLNTLHSTLNQSENVPSTQTNYLQSQTRIYGEPNLKNPPPLGQNFNISSPTVSNSSPNNSCFPPNYANYSPQVQTITLRTSFQSKESYSNKSQYQIPPPHIARPSNMPPIIPPHPVNYQRTMMSNSYNSNFTLPPPPQAMPIVQNIQSQLTDKSNLVRYASPAILPNSIPAVPQNMSVIFSQMETCFPPVAKPVSEKESKILSFLENITSNEKKKSDNLVIVAQFRSTLKQALSLVKKLAICKNNLSQLLQSDEKEWALEVNKVALYQNQLAQACTFLTTPKYLNCIHKKLKFLKKKRTSAKKLKQNILDERRKKIKEREQLNQEIDKWLDSIKEKNLKLKRETEMKKEADSILSEVRRKIQEAKRTVEKIKVFEKLRNIRQSNAAQRGLILPDHDEKFQKSISNLKETVYRQLSHYESEEKALKVMLEAEQEGQLEEEAKWKIKRLKTLQDKRQNNIIESLFGDCIEEPEEDEPIFLFYQFQNSGNKSIENLVQIRHHWDLNISESGEPVPHQWVVPVPPSSSGWEVALNS